MVTLVHGRKHPGRNKRQPGHNMHHYWHLCEIADITMIIKLVVISKAKLIESASKYIFWHYTMFFKFYKSIINIKTYFRRLLLKLINQFKTNFKQTWSKIMEKGRIRLHKKGKETTQKVADFGVIFTLKNLLKHCREKRDPTIPPKITSLISGDLPTVGRRGKSEVTTQITNQLLCLKARVEHKSIKVRNHLFVEKKIVLKFT